MQVFFEDVGTCSPTQILAWGAYLRNRYAAQTGQSGLGKLTLSN